MRDSLPALDLAAELPGGGEVQQIAYAMGNLAAAHTLLEIAEPVACRAVLVTAPIAAEQVLATLALLCIECEEQEGPELTASAWEWVEPEVPIDRRQGLLITLQGTRIIWCAGKAALIAPARRLAALRLALVEFALREALVRKIEQTVSAGWPELEADGPHAFHFDDRSAAHRERLAQRFQQVLELRMRLVRILPVLERPPMHPPTVASQLTERLKERTRLAERVEHLGNQLEVYERVYEMCGQRSSEYFFSRRETTLEWIIIVLLATETIVLLIDLMTTLGKT